MSNISSLLHEIQNHLNEVKPEVNNPPSSEALRRAKRKVREAILETPKGE